MKYIVPLLLLALASCEPKKVAQNPPALPTQNQVHIINSDGTTKVSDYYWKIIAEPGKPIKLQKLLDDEGGYSGTGDNTVPNKGWMVAIPSKEYLWYFDGKDNGMLIHYTPEVSTVYGLKGAQARATPPKEFLDRLPEQVRKSIAAEQGAAANP